jgi:hypothetical protein
MSRADELAAELEVVRLEEEYVAAKDSGTASDEQKLALRDARQRYRDLRAQQAPGEGVARPEPVQASAAVEEG